MRLFARGGDSPFVTVAPRAGANKRFEVESRMDIFPARLYAGGIDVMADTVEVADGDFGGVRVYTISRERKK